MRKKHIGKKRKLHRNKVPPMRCPYCGRQIVLRSADEIYHENPNHTMLYVCSRYPKCDAYARVVPGTKSPVSALANKSLRMLRSQAHYYFNQIFQYGLLTKTEAYSWLAAVLDLPSEEAHIGFMREARCLQVIEKSKEYLINNHIDPEALKKRKVGNLNENDKRAKKVS